MNEADITQRIQEAIASHKVFIFMKGSPEQPRCGFSARAVQALQECGATLGHLDVLEDPDVRATLPKIANWPTFPQIYIQGELVGGCDIVMELYQSGELKTMVEQAQA